MDKHIYNLKKDAEDKRDYLFTNIKGKNGESIYRKDVQIPEKMDLRPGYSVIKNQGQLGACTAFSACSVMEYLLGKSTDLSEMYFYWQERQADGDITQDGGSTIRRSALTATKGTCIESLDPYIVSKFAETPSGAADSDAVNHKVNAAYRCTDIDHILYAVGVLLRPVLIGIDVYESFENVGSDGFIPMPDTSKEQMLGGHALNICGYFYDMDMYNKIVKRTSKLPWWKRLLMTIFGNKTESTNKYAGLFFIIRNSWDVNFADKGYMYMSVDFLSNYSSDWWYLDIAA